MRSPVDRRTALVAGAALVATPGWTQGLPDPLAGERLYDDVKTYSGFGDHRTGGVGERACTAWMTMTMKEIGFQVEHQPISVPMFNLDQATLILDDRAIPAFPLWPPTPTGETGVSGILTTGPGPDEIGLLDFGPLPDPVLTPLRAAAVSSAFSAGARGVVIRTQALSGDYVALNVPSYQPPWPGPVLIVGGREGASLAVAAAAKTRIQMMLTGTRAAGEARNLIARRAGLGPLAVISTPKSGWFQCAGERGSGVALWLGLARTLASNTARNLLFAATTGHEFDNLGGQNFLTTRAPEPAAVDLWLHLGANIAVYDSERSPEGVHVTRQPSHPRFAGATEPLASRAARAFAELPGYAPPIGLAKTVAPGELGEITKAGYPRVVGLLGGQPLHHTPRDLPDVTGPGALEPVARALARLFELV